MNDAQLIQRWQRCEGSAKRLGVEIGTYEHAFGADFFVKFGKTKQTYQELNALWGFLSGMEVAQCCKRKK